MCVKRNLNIMCQKITLLYSRVESMGHTPGTYLILNPLSFSFVFAWSLLLLLLLLCGVGICVGVCVCVCVCVVTGVWGVGVCVRVFPPFSFLFSPLVGDVNDFQGMFEWLSRFCFFLFCPIEPRDRTCITISYPCRNCSDRSLTLHTK